MDWIANLLSRLRGLVHRRGLDAELDAELAHHLEMKAREIERSGATPAEARLASRRALGNATRWKEETRELWRFGYLESLASDAGYAFRLLRKDRVFTLVALATLTLGIGPNTAIFSLLNGLLWRPLPVAEPEQLVRLAVTHLPPTQRMWVNGRSTPPTERRQMTYPMYEALIRRQQVFTGLFATNGGGSMQLERNGIPRKVHATVVTGSFFPVLELAPQAGRLLTEADDEPGGAAGWTAVISDGLWTKLFARSPQAIGSAISMESVPFTIVGVAPASFKGIDAGAETEVWIPLSATEPMFPLWKWRTERDSWMLQPMARLRPGVTIEQAGRHLAAIGRAVLEDAKDPRWRAQYERYFLAMRIEPRPAATGQSGLAVAYGPTLRILFAAVAAVLLIAVTNLTNLFLARATARGYEIAVRLSLGAPASRVRRQLLLESLWLAAAGVAAGLVWARWLVSALQAAASTEASAVRIDTSLDARMFAFLALILLSTVVVAGLAPAFAATRVPLQAVMKKAQGEPRPFAFRRALVVLQTTLSLTLLAGAGLMLASLRELFTVPTGFQAENVAFVSPDLFNAGISRQRMPRAYQTLLSQIRDQANVAAAAWVDEIPLTGSLRTVLVGVPGRTDVGQDQRMIFVHEVSDGYFAAMGIPLLAGTDLPPAEAGRADVCVISESAARRFFGSPQEAVGRRLKGGAPKPAEVVGVVADAKYQNIREAAPATLYVPYWEGAVSPGMSLAVRYRGAMDVAVNSLQALFQKEAGRLPFTAVRTIKGNVAESLSAERLLAWLLGGLAAFALLISVTGLSGLLSYTVEQRRKDLGIRMALGATPRRIRREIRTEGLTLTGAGLLGGVLLSYGLRRSLDAYLFGITATDPLIWIAGIASLVAAALVATAIPAWRAAAVDPVAMLRDE